MAFKGFNSILFDIDSVIDIEISYIKFMAHEYRDIAINDFDKHKILYTKNEDLEFERMYGTEDLFSSIILPTCKYKSSYEKVFKLLVERDEEEVLKFAHFTAMKNLINAYRKAGDGVIKTAILCENKTQKDFISKTFPNTPIEFCSRSEANMGKYTRLICGNYKHALEYNLEEPKSILIVNFRENFTENDITLLRPELVISLGDIHDIEVISAYRNDIKVEG